MTVPQAPPRRRRRPFRPIEVVGVQRLGDRFVSVLFTGALDGFEEVLPAQHIKLMIPESGERSVTLPENGPDGPIWPADPPQPARRTYTPPRVARSRCGSCCPATGPRRPGLSRLPSATGSPSRARAADRYRSTPARHAG